MNEVVYTASFVGYTFPHPLLPTTLHPSIIWLQPALPFPFSLVRRPSSWWRWLLPACMLGCAIMCKLEIELTPGVWSVDAACSCGHSRIVRCAHMWASSWLRNE